MSRTTRFAASINGWLKCDLKHWRLRTFFVVCMVVGAGIGLVGRGLLNTTTLQGRVSCGGSPVWMATVTFVPVDQSEHVRQTRTDLDGRYEVGFGRETGVWLRKTYLVLVEVPSVQKPPYRVIPSKYSDMLTTDLSTTVWRMGGTIECDLPLDTVQAQHLWWIPR